MVVRDITYDTLVCVCERSAKLPFWYAAAWCVAVAVDVAVAVAVAVAVWLCVWQLQTAQCVTWASISDGSHRAYNEASEGRNFSPMRIKNKEESPKTVMACMCGQSAKFPLWYVHHCQLAP